MAVRKPLVLNGGVIEQLQTGDTLEGATSGKDVVALTNANTGSLALGDAVYVSAASSCDKAQANAAASARVIGLVSDATVGTGASANVQTDGVLSGLTGLTAGSVYFLDAANPGKLVAAAPLASGQFVVRVGTAISTTELEISISAPIRL